MLIEYIYAQEVITEAYQSNQRLKLQKALLLAKRKGMLGGSKDISSAGAVTGAEALEQAYTERNGSVETGMADMGQSLAFEQAVGQHPGMLPAERAMSCEEPTADAAPQPKLMGDENGPENMEEG
jgi:hypothetical protein